MARTKLRAPPSGQAVTALAAGFGLGLPGLLAGNAATGLVFGGIGFVAQGALGRLSSVVVDTDAGVVIVRRSWHTRKVPIDRVTGVRRGGFIAPAKLETTEGVIGLPLVSPRGGRATAAQVEELTALLDLDD
jgi:hypothetical protein